MKKIIILTLISALFISMTLPVSAVAGYTYTDNDSGVTFTVPYNWEEKPLNTNPEYIDVKFVSSRYEGECILYGSTDIWLLMSESEKKGHTRAQCDNSIFSKNDYATLLGVPISSLREVTYRGNTYIQGELTESTEVYGIPVSVTMTILVRIENGWMYTFQVSGTSTDEHYHDFLSLVNSVSYPIVETDNPLTAGDIIAIVVIVLGIIGLVIFLALKLAKKKQKNATQNPAFIAVPSDYIYCHMCGTKLPSNSKYCLKCGTFVDLD